MHIHSNYSRDCLLSLEKIITVCNNNGINCVAVTDHNTIQGALKLQKMALFKVIVGEEIMTDQGEITGLFLKEQIPPCLSMGETIARIKEQSGLLYVPHPFARLRRSTIKTDQLEKIWKEVDIIEVFNSRNMFNKSNREALQFAKSRSLLCGAGSDAHTGYEIGNAYVEISSFSSEQEFLESLRTAKLHMKKSIILVHGITKIIKIVRKIYRWVK